MEAASGKSALLTEHTRHEIDHWVRKFRRVGSDPR
jgi:hypothetical protein